MINKELIVQLVNGFMPGTRGIHGVAHWARVLENGKALAELSGAQLEVVELFSVLHDCQRWDDGSDPEHGRRAGQFVKDKGERFFNISKPSFLLLIRACDEHVDGNVSENITIQTCWDADRLDIARAFKKVDPRLMSQHVSAEIIDWATKRACDGYVPEFVGSEWGFDVKPRAVPRHFRKRLEKMQE